MDPQDDPPPPPGLGDPSSRRALWTAIAALCLATLVPAMHTSPARGAGLPPQGLYEGCAPSTPAGACAARLATIAAAGFRYVLNYSAWYGSPSEVARYADAAAALGLELIWPLNHPAWRGSGSLAATYPTLAGDAADRSNAAVVTGAIGLVSDHPATWGFYIGDEVPVGDAGRVGGLSATVRRLAPHRPQLYIARPGRALLRPFLPFADIAGVDAYPVGSGDPRVWRAAGAARAQTAAAGKRTAIVLQAFSWSQYRPGTPPAYPSPARLLAMRNAAIRHGNPAMILWYSFQDIVRSDAPQQRWSELRRAAFSPYPAPPRRRALANVAAA